MQCFPFIDSYYMVIRFLWC